MFGKPGTSTDAGKTTRNTDARWTNARENAGRIRSWWGTRKCTMLLQGEWHDVDDDSGDAGCVDDPENLNERFLNTLTSSICPLNSIYVATSLRYTYIYIYIYVYIHIERDGESDRERVR
jgi:hypothetical protein